MSKPTVYTVGAAFPIQGATHQKKRQVMNSLFLGVSGPVRVWTGTAWVNLPSPPA